MGKPRQVGAVRELPLQGCAVYPSANRQVQIAVRNGLNDQFPYVVQGS
jgi:hypothetical protein